MLLSVAHLYKAYGEDVIIKDATFTVDDGSKTAIVGNNGCGKSTLLKMITGEISGGGSVSIKKDASYGYLAQYQEDSFADNILNTVLSAREDLLSMEDQLSDMERRLNSLSEVEMDSFMEKYHSLQHQFDVLGGYTFRSEAVGVLKGLGFEEDDFSKGMNQLSGGQKTRVSLGRLLVSKPDLLLLDEPINHLDLNSIVWLENYLLNYKGAVVIVAHDRYFLDKICDHVVDLTGGNCHVYTGNYTAFVEQKRIARLTLERSYEKQQKEIEHQKQVIEKLQSYNREKSIKRAESRKKLLDKMDVIEAPVTENYFMRLNLEIDKESGKDVLFFENVTKSYGDKNIFRNLSFDVHKNDRIAIIGENGCGKTTILKVINGITDFEEGQIKLGANVSIGYYDQEQQGLNETNTIFEEIHSAYPYLTDTAVRNTLAAFLFTEDDVFKQIKALSGGERGRVALAKLMLGKYNFLILDEPTNHLDMETKQILEEAIKDYDGTLLYVSHDRYFVNQTANTILEMNDGRLTKYLGNYDEYLLKKEQLSVLKLEGTINKMAENLTVESTGNDGKLDYLEQKKQQANLRKLNNQINKLEEEIEELENKISLLDEEFLKPENSTNSAKLNELSKTQNELKIRLEDCYEQWELLNS
ncbi:MAG: ABC-F family ATP-binding cassette domain-containing protein [Pseudobutyrivibrio sp.]|nr:ABC-F family ATP-binding cassette domain-containing protein [Pseudobutyrivibrio sp.]